MALASTVARIVSEMPRARQESFGQHPLAQFIRGDAAAEVAGGLGEAATGLIVEGSAGAGNWAAVPWLAVFDPTITDSATRGYYLVYLFHTTAPLVHLSLNQGTTAVREEFGAAARHVLSDRAAFMRRRLSDFAPMLPVDTIELGSTARLPGDYSAGHALGISYDAEHLPPEETLRADLQTAVRAYRALTFRGGLDTASDEDSEVDEGPVAGGSLIERRRHRLHRHVERNPAARRLAKKFHGTRCQACGFDFGERYGSLGDGFIEVHHLKPIASLEEGVAVRYDVAADFAVLCANCHLMIHRTDDPSDLGGFRELLRLTRPNG